MAYDNDKLGAALKLYLGSDPLPMHMPGHKRNPDLISSEFARDITEIQGFDNLHSPSAADCQHPLLHPLLTPSTTSSFT